MEEDGRREDEKVSREVFFRCFSGRIMIRKWLASPVSLTCSGTGFGRACRTIKTVEREIIMGIAYIRKVKASNLNKTLAGRGEGS